MALKTITREEFDTRLAESTDRVRRERLTLEAQAAELEDLIGRYSAVLERLEAEAGRGAESSSGRRSDLRKLLTELAERTSLVAASL